MKNFGLLFVSLCMLIGCSAPAPVSKTLLVKAVEPSSVPPNSPVIIYKSGIELLSQGEWKGKCRKVVNESGEEIKLKNQKYVRLQTSYNYSAPNLIMWVKTFKDSNCKILNDVMKYTEKCSTDPEQGLSICKSTKWEETKDGVKWIDKPVRDYNGFPITSESKVTVESIAPTKVKILVLGESEENDPEILIKE